MAFYDEPGHEGGDHARHGPRVPAGRYKARAAEGALGETSKGTEQVAVLFEIIDRDAEGAPGPLDGEHVQWFGHFTEKTTAKTLEGLRNAGWRSDDLTDLAGLGECECSIVVEHETYEGRTTAKVRWVNKPGGLGLKTPLVGDKAKAFAAKMRGYAIQSRQAGGTPNAAGAYAHPGASSAAKPPAQQPPPRQPITQSMGVIDDDIPF